MSILDRAIAAVTPMESDEARRAAREQAERLAEPGDWLSQILDHHRQIEAGFGAVSAAQSGEERRTALKRLATLLTGHSLAEEAVIYPAISWSDEDAQATLSYTEQAAAKLQLGLLQHVDPMSQDFMDKLEHLRGAVLHHVYKEEGSRFPRLRRRLSADEQRQLTAHYREEYERYYGGGDAARMPSRSGHRVVPELAVRPPLPPQ